MKHCSTHTLCATFPLGVPDFFGNNEWESLMPSLNGSKVHDVLYIISNGIQCFPIFRICHYSMLRFFLLLIDGMLVVDYQPISLVVWIFDEHSYVH
mmetsp:Transcript_20458/g.37075  ORF Transcript_20458/g.37075 Transcript_20458/m.37075 type:complete len:96 (+) Transcript_20458:59-346(+)